jgi:hypothetical protein
LSSPGEPVGRARSGTAVAAAGTVDRVESAPLGAALDAARTRAFVGRLAEREMFAAGLASGSTWSVLWIHGPGGVGKSTLLEQLAVDARDAGAHVVAVDARSLLAMDDAGARHEPVSREAPDEAAEVVLVDAVEHLGSGESFLREEWFPKLPAGTLAVVAGRMPPDAAWRADPAWRDRLRIVSLRNLDYAAADRYLDHFGVAADQRPSLIEASHGHPLALSLLADLAARERSKVADLAGGLASAPDIVEALLSRIIDEVPSGQHRELLEVAAVARVTTEALVRDALAVDRHRARELFDWLRSRSYVESRSDGVSPHDLVRDVLDADLRWRDPEAYATVFRRVRRHIHSRLETLRGLEQRRAIADEKFVFRNLPSVLSPVDWSSWGEADPEPARAGDRDGILGLVQGFEGAEAAAIAQRWLDRQPHGFHVLRDPAGGVQGFIALLELTQDPTGDLSFDPVAAAAMAFTEREAPVRAGEVVTLTRFVIDRDGYQAPSPTVNAVPILTLQRYLQNPELSWDFLALFEPDAMNDYFAIADLPRAENADATVGGRRYGLFAHDFRRVPVSAWLEGVTDRALAQDPAPPAAAPPELIVLSHEAFTDAVRGALRDLHRPDRLAANPLARSRLVHDHPGGSDAPAQAIAELIATAADVLGGDPRDDKRHRAVAHTYLAASPISQERVAESLGIPFSTYRRHLTEGVEAMVDHLWRRELHGPAVGDPGTASAN